MESEVELNDIIQEMHVIATVPNLYHIIIELNAVRSLLGLLSHENTGMFLWFSNLGIGRETLIFPQH